MDLHILFIAGFVVELGCLYIRKLGEDEMDIRHEYDRIIWYGWL